MTYALLISSTMAAAGKKYGLVMTKKPAQKPATKASNVFGNDSSDEDEDGSVRKVNASLKKPGWVTKEARDVMEKALQEDPSVFEYDAVYDEMENKKRESDPRLKSQEERKPKYILQLMKAAEQRKREQEIIFERKQKKEIDREKELYGEKDAFVTPSYLKLLEERKAEEERLRKEEEREASVKNKDMNLFYRNLLNRRVSEGSEREGKGKESRDADVTRHSQKQATKSAETGSQEYAADGSRSMPEVSRRRPSPSPEPGGTHRKTASNPSADANQRGRLSSSEMHDSPDQQQRPKSPSGHLAVKETPSAGDSDTEEAATVSKPLSKEDAKLAAEIVRKRRAEQRNDEHSVSAARARYLARKKAKQTAVSKTNDVP